jgi:hypothetical protein
VVLWRQILGPPQVFGVVEIFIFGEYNTIIQIDLGQKCCSSKVAQQFHVHAFMTNIRRIVEALNGKETFVFLWLNGKGGFFGDALCLFEVTLFVDDDDAIGVHEAVGDRGRDW